MYEFWYDYAKPKYGENAKLCYMDTSSFIFHVKKTDDIYKDILEDVGTKFDTSNFELDRSLPKEKKLESNWVNKDELGEKIMKIMKIIKNLLD